MKKTSKNSRDREREIDKDFHETLGFWPDKPDRKKKFSDEDEELRSAIRGYSLF